MDLKYRIYSVWLYDDQLAHDYIFLYKGNSAYTLYNAPYYMFGGSYFCANEKINSLKSNKNYSKYDVMEMSIDIMKEAAYKSGTLFIKSSDFITLKAIQEPCISYREPFYTDVNIEKSGKYKGLKKVVYTPFDIIWNETKSNINPFEYDIMGVWKPGDTSYTSYRIWEEKQERKIANRNHRLNELGIL